MVGAPFDPQCGEKKKSNENVFHKKVLLANGKLTN
jgi:hypothetical protein